MKKAAILILLTGIFSLTFYACGGGAKGASPSDTVDKALKLYMKKDFEKTAAMYASGDNKKLTKEELDKITTMFPFAFQQDEKKDGLKSYEILEETIAEDGNTANVKYKKIYGNGKEDVETAKLVKIDGDWLISLKFS